MKVRELHVYGKEAKECAQLLSTTFPVHFPKSQAKEEIIKFLKDTNILYVALENEQVIGFAGVLKEKYLTAHQLELMVIKKDRRGEGIGTKLLDIVEHRLRDKGSLTLYLGSDDEGYKTSLTGEDLYVDTFDKLFTLKSENHPYIFYQKKGYSVVGVIPDAYGYGNPDIMMAKRLKN